MTALEGIYRGKTDNKLQFLQLIKFIFKETIKLRFLDSSKSVSLFFTISCMTVWMQHGMLEARDSQYYIG